MNILPRDKQIEIIAALTDPDEGMAYHALPSVHQQLDAEGGGYAG